jgi:predicted amidophosphoribosyltransferase
LSTGNLKKEGGNFLKGKWRSFFDKQEEPPAALCDECGAELYQGDRLYVIDGFAICPECFKEYAEKYFADCLKTAAEGGRYI